MKMKMKMMRKSIPVHSPKPPLAPAASAHYGSSTAMRVALLAPFPLHIIPGFEQRPRAHYATWLPQLSARFAEAQGWDFHWITMSKRFVSEEPIRWRGESFHFLQNTDRLRMLRGYQRDCRLIRERLDLIQSDPAHPWGSGVCSGFGGALSRG